METTNQPLNKPYFAKYLTVEEEINEGDIVKTMGEERTIFKKGMDPKAYKKYKLFLCTRNVELEDYLVPGRVYVHFDGSEAPYKVLGEISPGAIWVQEGDEFEKTDLGGEDPKILGPIALIYYDFEKTGYLVKGPCGQFH